MVQRLSQVKDRLARAERSAGRIAGSVRLLAVSKGHDAGAVRQVFEAGQVEFGENYLQEAVDKMAALGDARITWHFIGPIQSNKTRDIAARFHWAQSVDREKIARRLSDQRPAEMAPLNVLVQINISGEASKSGVTPEQTADLCRAVDALPRLRLRGLMAIPEHSHDPAVQARNFGALRALYEGLREDGLALDTLSMGMSDDLEAAVAEGATMVRIGTAIFGPRHYAD